MTKMINPFGFKGPKDGLLCSSDPITGGIIDNEIVSKRWFVIFLNPTLEMITNLPSRDAAIAAYNEKMLPLIRSLK